MRKLRTPVLFGALVFIAACSGDDDPQVTTITVSPATASILVLGGTEQFTAEVLDQNGSPMPEETVLWSTDDENIATIDQNGRARALAEGTVNVTASVGNVAGQASLAISSAPCTEDVALAPGEVAVFQVACDVFIPSGSSGDRYRVAIVNQDSSDDDDRASKATLVVTALDVVTAPTAPAVQAPPVRDRRELSLQDQKHIRWGAMLQNRTREVHSRLRAGEAMLLRALGPEAVGPGRPLAGEGLQGQVEDLPDRITLRNNEGDANGIIPCKPAVDPTPAFLLAENADLAVYQDSALNADPATEVTASEAQLLLDYYSDHGKGVIDQYFPGLPDKDGNGKVIVYISFNDDLDDGAVAAYAWGGDLFDGGDDGCLASNDGELTYFNASLVREVDEGFVQALETVVHEVKHISSFWQAIGRSRVFDLREDAAPQAFQPSWIEEGSAEIASNIASRVAWQSIGGPAPNAKVGEEELRNTALDGTGRIRPEAFGVLLRLTRLQGYLASQPNGLVVTPVGADGGHSVYGSGWTFLRWLGDAYGQAGSRPLADAPFFANQNDSTTLSGVRGLETITGQSFDQLLEEFAGTVMLHETGAPEGDRALTSYDFISSIEMWCFSASEPTDRCSGTGPPGTFPWPVTTSSTGVMTRPFANATFTGQIGHSGIRVHDFVSDGSGTGIQLSITAQQPSRLVVTRLR